MTTLLDRAELGARAKAVAVRFRPALPAVGLYYAIQVVGVVVLILWTSGNGLDPVTEFSRWDAGWFMRIADRGYEIVIPVDTAGQPLESTLVFFPGYPGAIAAVMAVTGLSPVAAGLVVTGLAGGIAAAGLFFLGRLLFDARVGTSLAVLWAMAPGSLVLHLVYSEALFCALAVWALVAVVKRYWILAAVLTFAAGLTRSTAIALVAAVMLAALIAVIRKRDGWRPWVALGVAPLGLGYYLALVGWYTGRIDGWLWIQSGAWKMRFDGGVFTANMVWDGLVGNENMLFTLTGFVIVASVLLLLWSFTERLPAHLYVYAVGVMVLALGAGSFWSSRPRFLLAAFVIAIPLAVLVSKLPNRALPILLPIGALAAGWYGASLMVLNVTP
ncbi:hypothetical protein [Actinokineospora sp. HUAS TT18]|uniref:hypothetical protein n=1 Tax=Actinokineospora sp. HUAS TT18 TaxID=3447451 RepID=UPI003F5268E9